MDYRRISVFDVQIGGEKSAEIQEKLHAELLQDVLETPEDPFYSTWASNFR